MRERDREPRPLPGVYWFEAGTVARCPGCTRGLLESSPGTVLIVRAAGADVAPFPTPSGSIRCQRCNTLVNWRAVSLEQHLFELHQPEDARRLWPAAMTVQDPGEMTRLVSGAEEHRRFDQIPVVAPQPDPLTSTDNPKP